MFYELKKSSKRRVIKVIKHVSMGRRVSQPLWEWLHRLSLEGMNIGSGSNVRDSGELWVIDYLGRYSSKNRQAIIFDVGANIGSYSSTVISRLGKTVRLYCFEPSKKAFELLASNIAEHRNVELFNFGCGDKEEFVTLYCDVEGSGLASVYERRLNHFGITMKQTEQIHLRTLDNFCRDKRIEYISLLKLDVEGHELKVLNGAHGLINSNSIDFIQFEFGGCNIDSRTYFQDFFYLLNPYYEIHRIVKDGIVLIEHYEERHEVFVTTNYLAISRKIQ